jgi:phosphatidylglycerophosphatase A
MIKAPNLLIYLATALGLGFIKYAPGTIASLLAIPIYILMSNTPFYAKFLLFIILFLAGIFSSGYYEFYSGQKDPGEVTIDEVTAYYFVLIFLPLDLYYIIVSFILFRFFDIFKIYPIKKYEKIKGGLGIMLDDLIAAIYTLISIYILIYLWCKATTC